MRTRLASMRRPVGVCALFVLVLLAATACQSSNPNVQSPRPRSREAAGDQANLPFEEATSGRVAIDSTGGELEFREARLVIPRGAVPEPIFFEIAIPDEPPQGDVLPFTAFQLSPDSLELERDALLKIAFYDGDVPAGKEESDIVIVRNVNGVWVELSNSVVDVYANIVQAPIRYLGLYALRVASDDPRRLNTMPVASFEFSFEPYPEAVGKPFEEAQAEMEAKEAEAQEPVAPEDEFTGAPGETPPEVTGAPGETPVPEDTTPPNEAGAPIGALQPGMVEETRIVAGPEEEAIAAREADQAGITTNIAEGDAPVPAMADDELPQSDSAETTIYFNASTSYDPDGTVVQYDWDFDCDGVFDYTSHQSPYAEHTFRYTGDYSVVLKVSDNGRYTQSGFGTGVVNVRSAKPEPKPISANIGVFPPEGPIPLTSWFGATVTGGTPPYVYRWTFSDGSQSALANPYTTYPDPGEHKISFNVTDIMGESLSGSLWVTSQHPEHPATPQPQMLLSITPSVERGTAPLHYKFGLRAERAAPPVSYRISYGDEAPGEEETVTTFPSGEHVYANTGFYLMKVVATDAELRTASTFATIHVKNPADPRDFTDSDANAAVDPFSFGHRLAIVPDYRQTNKREVHLKADNLPIDSEILSYNWDFGDGTFSTEPDPRHTFARDSVFEVRLTVSDGLERWRTRSWLPISAEEPAVAIQRQAYIEGTAPFRLTLDSIATRAEEPLRYDWFIGEARRSDASTYYAFTEAGDYEISLDIYDKNDQPIHAPPIEVKVRPGPVDYRLPLAVVQPLMGSTRALVIDHTAANPLPLSSPSVEGPVNLVDLSADGQVLGIAGPEGLLLKRVSNGIPLLSFLPGAGEIIALQALSISNAGERQGAMAYATVESAGGMVTYLLRNEQRPVAVSRGMLVDASGSGERIILADKHDPDGAIHTMFALDPAAGQVGEGIPLGQLYGARLSRDGRTLLLIDNEYRLQRRNVATGEQQFLGSTEDLKSSLAISADARAVAFVSQLGEQRDVIYGREVDGVMRLTSLTEQTGFFSEHFQLSADGRYMLAYGSRTELAELMAAETGTQIDEEQLIAGSEDELRDVAPSPPRRRERFGVIRLNLSSSPSDWSLSKMDPKFVAEGEAQFALAGPFN